MGSSLAPSFGISGQVSVDYHRGYCKRASIAEKKNQKKKGKIYEGGKKFVKICMQEVKTQNYAEHLIFWYQLKIDCFMPILYTNVCRFFLKEIDN